MSVWCLLKLILGKLGGVSQVSRRPLLFQIPGPAAPVLQIQREGPVGQYVSHPQTHQTSLELPSALVETQETHLGRPRL